MCVYLCAGKKKLCCRPGFGAGIMFNSTPTRHVARDLPTTWCNGHSSVPQAKGSGFDSRCGRLVEGGTDGASQWEDRATVR